LGALLTREPGGTAAGEHIRSLLLDPSLPAVVGRAETLLMVAARAQHVDEVIRPTLAAGRDVVCDRFSGSTIAYQGYGRGLDPAELAALSSWAAGGLEPDLVLLLQVDASTARARAGSRAAGGSDGRVSGGSGPGGSVPGGRVPGGRVTGGSVSGGRVPDGRDRIEAEPTDFFDRIDAGFAALAAASPDRWRVVDGSGSVDEVAGRVWAAFDAALGRPPRP
jgi:dTMP kinase